MPSIAPAPTNDNQGSTLKRVVDRPLSESTKLWLSALGVDVAFGFLALGLDVLGGPGPGTDLSSRLFNLLGALLGIYVLLFAVVLAIAGAVLLVSRLQSSGTT